MDHMVSVPSSGDYQFLQIKSEIKTGMKAFPSPHPGIINFFEPLTDTCSKSGSFRPLIRGLSISSRQITVYRSILFSFRPLIRGLSISSYANREKEAWYVWVSVPSSGDYQFLPENGEYNNEQWSFRPLIRGLSISSVAANAAAQVAQGFRPLIRGLSISSRMD